MGQIALIIRISSVSAAELASLRQQFQQFLHRQLFQQLVAANANTQVTIAVDKNSTHAENV